MYIFFLNIYNWQEVLVINYYFIKTFYTYLFFIKNSCGDFWIEQNSFSTLKNLIKNFKKINFNFDGNKWCQTLRLY